MAFERPDITVIRDRVFADIRGRLSGSNPFLRRSNLYALGIAVAGQSHNQYGYLLWLTRQIFPDTAETEYLDRWAGIYGVIRKLADSATGTVLFTGTALAVIPINTIIERSDGVQFKTSEAAVIAASGEISVPVEAIEGGVLGNTTAGDTLTIVNPLLGVDAGAVVEGDGFYNGTDDETDADLSARVLFRIQRPPHGGAASDYLQWMLENSGVTRGFVFPWGAGAGTVSLTWLYDGRSNPFPLQADIDAMDAYLYSHTDPATGDTVGRPATANLYLYALEEQKLNPQVRVRPDTTEVRQNVTNELNAFLLREITPGVTLYTSRISEAISLAQYENSHDLVYPSEPVQVASSSLLTLGEVQFLAQS